MLIPEDRIQYNTKVTHVEEVILYPKYFKTRKFDHLYELTVQIKRVERKRDVGFLLYVATIGSQTQGTDSKP